MKKNWKITAMILALLLAMALGVTALAETSDVPSQDAPAADAVTAATGTVDPALQEALEALTAARSGDWLADLEAELKAYVEAGKLTQEQADLILKAYKEQESLRNGICPNCGYQFSNGGFGHGGRMKNGNGNGMNGFGAKGGRGGRGGQGRFGQPQNGAQQNAAPAPAGTPDAGET